MRKSSITRALGGGALALGLVAAGTVAAAAEDQEPVADQGSGQDQAQDLLAAMERDLGLTTAEAEQRMADEAEARSIDNELRTELGEAWGGSYFDGDSGELTVAVTDESATDEVAAAGANPEIVTYGTDELEAIVDEFNAQGSQLGNGITGWYADSSADAVVVEVTSGNEDAVDDLVSETGVEAGAVQAAETDEAPELYADIVGGDPYMIGGTGRCSIGFAVEGGFATAGHCGDVGTEVSSEDGSGTGTVGGSEFPGTDMGFVEADDNWTPTSTVNDYEGGTLEVAGSEQAPEGASICRSGSTTGFHCGEIEAHDQTVEYPQGQVQGLTQTNVCAEPGDSGGSWLADDQAQGVTSGGSGNCTIGGTTFYQPIEPILDEFNLTLVTS
ncbi:S1 family peptidase [Allosalinactinospora lopnorensis]|uniref:S1 family peptidase n=1 Tax=Allosalinactinospora lopnorensis TaxID=1352348 RepID=UPI000623FB51|nr:S1 family peptidase [Allosalinactinospora lopnorensis]